MSTNKGLWPVWLPGWVIDSCSKNRWQGWRARQLDSLLQQAEVLHITQGPDLPLGWFFRIWTQTWGSFLKCGWRLHNKTQQVFLEKSWSCNAICRGLIKILVHGIFGVFQNPGGPIALVKMVQVKHEMHFCKVTFSLASVPLCLASGTGILNCEREDDFAVAVLYNVLCTAIHNMHKATEEEPTVSLQIPFIQGVSLKCHFCMLAVAKRAEIIPKPLPVMNFCGS